MGPSGSGKTTLLVDPGLPRPAERRASTCSRGGTSTALGDDELSRLRNRSVGFVFQAFHLIPQLTVVGERRDAAALRGRAAPRVAAAGARARSSAWASRTAPTTARPSSRAARRSGPRSRARSSRRRACCSPTSPPATSTPATGEEIRALLDELHAQGATVVLVTHNEALGRARRARGAPARRAGRVGGAPVSPALVVLLRLGARSLRLHKLRSSLSILGRRLRRRGGRRDVVGRRGGAPRDAGADRGARHRHRDGQAAPRRLRASRRRRCRSPRRSRSRAWCPACARWRRCAWPSSRPTPRAAARP